MKSFEFTVILKSEPDEELADKLYGVIQDGTICTISGVSSIEFARESQDLETALKSAVSDIQSTGIAIERVEFQPDSLVASS